MKLIDNRLHASAGHSAAWLPASGASGMPLQTWQRLDRVRDLACKLQRARGSSDGTDLRDWLAAERELDGED